MKKNIYSVFVISSIIILLINIFVKSKNLTEIIIFSCNLFIKNIFPSLFPMFIISYILVEIDFPKLLGFLFKRIFKLFFNTSELSSFVFFMSMLTGFPGSAKMIDDLINKEELTAIEAQKILCFTFFSNPLFIINTVGNTFFNSKKIGFFIFIALVIGNILTGIFFRNSYTFSTNSHSFKEFSMNSFVNKINKTDIFKTVFEAINSSLKVMINIFGIVTFFIILINILFNKPSSFFTIFLTGIFEMTTGLKYLTLSNYSFNTKLITSIFFISFGSFSVHAQIMNILKEKKVKYLPFLYSRMIHSLFSILAFLIIGILL